jgi:hypothetical protein
MPTWMSAAEQAEVWDRYEAGEYMLRGSRLMSHPLCEL